jgi:flavin reductase (DIM6/NTAB) family NADH-FMN oxidoreductase RutF
MTTTTQPITAQPSDIATPQAFRGAMAAVAAPVAVVTALDGDRPHGTTVSAFASHSLTPPMVLVSLDNRSQLLAVIRRTGRFGLNILGVHQADLATAFARTGPDKFDGIAWSASPGRRGTWRASSPRDSASPPAVRRSTAAARTGRHAPG